MFHDSLEKNRKYLLACDHRFSDPDVYNDHVWEVRLTQSKMQPVSFFTTFGLCAKSMLLYPTFRTVEPRLIKNCEFSTKPRLLFKTTNFIEMTFSPFMSIDVLLRFWVPASQVLVGQILMKNSSPATLSVNMDWIARLDPLSPGKSMVLEQKGINKVLCGQSGGLFPLFYMSGGPEESTSAEPGLHTRSILPAGMDRQVTWVMTAMDSLESSLQTARRFSSRQLDLEKLKIEMEDQRNFIRISGADGMISQLFYDTQIQAHQLIMPGLNTFRKHTFLSERTPLTPSISNPRFPQLNPAWSGQSLPTLHQMAGVLLPGFPLLLRQLVINELDSQTQDGTIDVCVNAGNQATGLIAPPLLCSLVEMLIPYIHDRSWFSTVYTRLEGFTSKWVSGKGIRGFTHPLQTGFMENYNFIKESQQSLWIRLSCCPNLYLLSLLLKEIEALKNIARKTDINPSAWVNEAEKQVRTSLQDLWDGIQGSVTNLQSQEGGVPANRIVADFSKNGKVTVSRRFKHPCALYLKISSNEHPSTNFSIQISGRAKGKPRKISLNHRDFHRLGDVYLSIIHEPFTTISSFYVSGMKEPFTGQLGIADLSRSDITQLLPLWADVKLNQVRKMNVEAILPDYLDETGLWLEPDPGSPENTHVPDFLASFIIEGLWKSGFLDLARQTYQKHFLSDDAIRRKNLEAGRVSSLIPVFLFLKIYGVRQIGQKELILQSFNIPGEPLTVQYGKIEMTITPGALVLKISGQAPLIITTEEPQRVKLG